MVPHGFSTGPDGQVVAADEKVASEAAAEADGIKKETRCVGSCGVAAMGESRTFHGTKSHQQKPYDWGNQDPLAMGYSWLLPIFKAADVGINRRFLLARLPK